MNVYVITKTLSQYETALVGVYRSEKKAHEAMVRDLESTLGVKYTGNNPSITVKDRHALYRFECGAAECFYDAHWDIQEGTLDV